MPRATIYPGQHLALSPGHQSIPVVTDVVKNFSGKKKKGGRGGAAVPVYLRREPNYCFRTMEQIKKNEFASFKVPGISNQTELSSSFRETQAPYSLHIGSRWGKRGSCNRPSPVVPS